MSAPPPSPGTSPCVFLSESVFVYFTDPAIPDPLGNHNLSTFVGVLPYARIPAGNATRDHVRTSIVSIALVQTPSRTVRNFGDNSIGECVHLTEDELFPCEGTAVTVMWLSVYHVLGSHCRPMGGEHSSK